MTMLLSLLSTHQHDIYSHAPHKHLVLPQTYPTPLKI